METGCMMDMGWFSDYLKSTTPKRESLSSPVYMVLAGKQFSVPVSHSGSLGLQSLRYSLVQPGGKTLHFTIVIWWKSACPSDGRMVMATVISQSL